MSRDLDKQIQAVHERYWDEQKQRGAKKTVVLVEGDDDRSVVEALLTRRRATWETRVSVSVAGGRRQVLSRIGDHDRFPNAYGLVDRDTWSDREVDEQRKAAPNLFVTAGWCLENMFLDPGWLKAFDGAVAARVAAQREAWVRAGALWWTLQRVREGQQLWQEKLGWDYGRPRDDLDTSAADKLAASLERRVPESVRRGSRFDLDAVKNDFDLRCREVLEMPEKAQWQVGVHGKAAFADVLVPALNAARGYHQSAAVWRTDLAAQVDPPAAPFDGLLAMLLP